ncbi:MAG: hypothetical protein GY870_12600 [archaeon]|nr:hypothetical protein [archaeon]
MSLPKRKKRFKVSVIKVVCTDCQAVMERWVNPYDEKEEHFETRCPVCGMHIRHYEKTFYCIDESGRCYLEVQWDKDIEWKTEFLKKEKNYWDEKIRQAKEFEDFSKEFNKADKEFDDGEPK